MENRTKKLLILLVVIAVVAGGFYGYKAFFAEKPAPPKLMVTMGAPSPASQAPIAAPAPAAGAAAKTAANAPSPAAGQKKPAQPPVVAAPAAKPGETARKAYTYSSLGKRDPFMNPFEIPKAYPPVPPNAKPLQRVAVESLAVKAIIWNEKGYRAMILGPDGRGYTVKAGDGLGDKLGRITRISERCVYVTEKIRDILGDVEIKNTVLKLHKEAE